MGLSGFASLAYQIVWTQQLGTWLGHEIVSVLAVIAAFFGGLALGAWWLGRPIARARCPGRWVAALETVIGLWALCLLWLLPAAGAKLTAAIGPDPSPLYHWGWAFVGPFLLLLPATAAMGATLPAMARVLDRLRDQGYAVGGLYAANTGGAVLGTLAAAFILVPWLGLTLAAGLAVGLNLFVALLAWYGLSAVRRPPPCTLAKQRRPSQQPLYRLALTGLLGIGFEVLVVRVLSQIAENTVYTYALLLAVYLVGTALGAALYQRSIAHCIDDDLWRTRLLALTTASGLLSVGVLTQAPTLKLGLQAGLGGNLTGALGAEAGVALLAFALPTIAMGALFSHLCVEAREAGWSLGDALAVNTLGAACAAPLFGVALLPVFGAAPLLIALSMAYLLLLPQGARRSIWAWSPAIAGAVMLALGPSLRVVAVPPGGRLLSHEDGVMATVSVVEDALGVRRLHINNREQEGSNVTQLSDARLAWLPLLLHPAPREVLFLGVGTGVTSAAAAADPRLRVDAVELLPEVIAARHWFTTDTRDGDDAPKVHTADARRYIRSAGPHYDVIVADLFHPGRSGSGALYTVEHFAAVAQRLRSDGLFCQWLPLHQMDLASLKSVVAAFLAVFPDARAMWANHSLETPVIGLIGRPGAVPLSLTPLEARWRDVAERGLLTGLQFEDSLAVVGSLAADADSLRRFAGDARVNRDDTPVVAYQAPRLTYASENRPRERLKVLLTQWHVDAAGMAENDEAARRLHAYWTARDQFLLAGMAVRPDANLHGMLSQVQEPLMAVLHTSPEFRPAYDPLLRMAAALIPQDPAAARALLQDLHDAQPSRPEAALLLRRLPANDASFPVR